MTSPARILHFLTIALVIVMVPGCQMSRLAKKSRDLRVVMNDLYTDQIMDNLIRARLGLPFVQLEYTEVFAELVDAGGGSAKYGHTTTENDPIAGTALTTVQHVVTEPLEALANFSVSDKITIKAAPVTKAKAVYMAYMTAAGDTNFLICEPTPPGTGAAHIARKYGNQWFWVPKERAPQFLKLAMETTFQPERDKGSGPSSVTDQLELLRNAVERLQ